MIEREFACWLARTGATWLLVNVQSNWTAYSYLIENRERVNLCHMGTAKQSMTRLKKHAIGDNPTEALS